MYILVPKPSNIFYSVASQRMVTTEGEFCIKENEQVEDEPRSRTPKNACKEENIKEVEK